MDSTFQNPSARRDFQLSDCLDRTFIICNISVADTERKLVLMIIIFCEMTPCSSYKNRRFGGSYLLNLTTSLCNQLALVHPEDGGDTILRNVGFYKSHTVSFPRR
jgi:hypothetical protein